MTRRKYAQDFSGDSPVQRHFKDSCDVNNIVRRYQQTGLDQDAHRVNLARFGWATSKSFDQAMFEVAAINSAFAELPSDERQFFQNDPGRWLDHLHAELEKSAPEASEAVSEPSGSPEAPSEPLPTESNGGTAQ